MLNDKSKTALYTAVALLKGVIMERALLLNPDAHDEFIKGIDKATDALIADMYERVNTNWEALAKIQNEETPSNVITREDMNNC